MLTAKITYLNFITSFLALYAYANLTMARRAMLHWLFDREACFSENDATCREAPYGAVRCRIRCDRVNAALLAVRG